MVCDIIVTTGGIYIAGQYHVKNNEDVIKDTSDTVNHHKEQ